MPTGSDDDWTRREFLALASLALGCASEEAVDMPGMPFQPWHMWGTSYVIQVDKPGASGVASVTHQLAKVSYKRPETWRFFFAARLVDGNVNTSGGDEIIIVDFDLIIGVGRSNYDTTSGEQLSGFCSFLYRIPNGFSPASVNTQTKKKWTTTVPSPILVDGIATTTYPLTTFVAQDVQCSARIQVPGGTDPRTATVEVSSYFAPNVHVRPDWYSDGTQFRGAETGGT